jgi:hypothetical protein
MERNSLKRVASRRLPFDRGIAVPLACAAMLAIASQAYAQIQDPFFSALDASFKAAVKKDKAKHPAPKDPLQPSIDIPVTPLGFAPPARFYLGDRFSQVSLDFLDEDNLLFTFRVPGLIPRERPAPGQAQQDQRHIRALTLSLPTGKVTAEAVWVLHDYSRYVWMRNDGKFLLRDRNSLEIGDASLHLEPFLRFPGPVNFIELDPDQKWLVADTKEPSTTEKLQESPSDDQTASLSPSTASAGISVDGQQDLSPEKSQSPPENLVRILNMDTRKVLLFSHVQGSIHLPIDGEGYYDALRGNGSHWLVNFEHFNGATNPLGWVDSTCNPALQVLSHGVVLASACTDWGARHLIALSRDRDKDHSSLWDVTLAPTKVWPLVVSSANGLRAARATLEVSHAVGPYNPLDDEDIRAQSVQVYDLATGKVQLTVPASPILDGGGNFALSPSGNRFAVLNAGSIQIFDLPPAPLIPPPAPAQNPSASQP